MNTWKSILTLTCPNCHKGKLFSRRGLVVYSRMIEMPVHCSQCGLKFEREPGFWIGALWTSYPLVIIIEIPFLFSALMAKSDNAMWFYFGGLFLSLGLLYPLLIRLGRSIWIHINVSYNSQDIKKP